MSQVAHLRRNPCMGPNMLDADSIRQVNSPRSDATSEFQSETLPSGPAIIIPGINADGSLFPIEKIEAHQRDVHHLAISIFLYAGSQLLIQRRAMGKYHCGGLWANTCCTHPHMNENIECLMTLTASTITRRLPKQHNDESVICIFLPTSAAKADCCFILLTKNSFSDLFSISFAAHY